MKRILFVDDEVELLESLRARLYKRRGDWDMTFVTSGTAVFQELEKQPFDLIVSDVRMPGIDGGELLRVLREHWPETIRIVLSGYAEQAQMLRLVSLAHQYLSKPCDAQKLENIIDRCIHLHELLKKPALRAAVGRIGSLPPVPEIYAKLQAALASPNTTAAELADLIAHDPAIATKVLQVANSAFFRLARPVTRIKDAVAYLGFGSIRNLVMSAEVFARWEHVEPIGAITPAALQHHALLSAAATASLCTDDSMMDDAWLAGLVHDIGYWVLLKECPDELARVVALANTQGIDTCAAEQQVFGATHAEIGAYLLGLWGLPYSLVEAVALHHSPLAVPAHGFDLLAMVATAHALMPVDAEDLAMSSEHLPVITADNFQRFNPPFDWQEAARRVQRACLTEMQLSQAS